MKVKLIIFLLIAMISCTSALAALAPLPLSEMEKTQYVIHGQTLNTEFKDSIGVCDYYVANVKINDIRFGENYNYGEQDSLELNNLKQKGNLQILFCKFNTQVAGSLDAEYFAGDNFKAYLGRQTDEKIAETFGSNVFYTKMGHYGKIDLNKPGPVIAPCPYGKQAFQSDGETKTYTVGVPGTRGVSLFEIFTHVSPREVYFKLNNDFGEERPNFIPERGNPLRKGQGITIGDVQIAVNDIIYQPENFSYAVSFCFNHKDQEEIIEFPTTGTPVPEVEQKPVQEVSSEEKIPVEVNESPPTSVQGATQEPGIKPSTKSKGMLFYFFTDTCPHCTGMDEELKQVGDKLNLEIVKSNILKDKKLPEKYQIRAVPTLVLIKDDGSFIKKEGKADSSSIIDWIESSANLVFEPAVETKEEIPLKDKVYAMPEKELVKDATYICNGCQQGNKCYPYGYRIKGTYCSDANQFINQLESGQICDNSFECNSNVCVDGECISGGLLRQIIGWLKGFFGG